MFVDTTSTYWEIDGADELADLGEDVVEDDTSRPDESGTAYLGPQQGPPGGPAAGDHRYGGHPRRDSGALLDLPRQHR